MIAVKLLRLPHAGDLPLPSRQTALAAGFDLMAAVPEEAPLVLAPGARTLVPTGFAVEMPGLCEGQIRPRSGLALKHGVTVLNAPGVIDADYRGEVCVLLINHGDKEFVIPRGLRVAQIVFVLLQETVLQEVLALSSTERGERGFGSTG